MVKKVLSLLLLPAGIFMFAACERKPEDRYPLWE